MKKVKAMILLGLLLSGCATQLQVKRLGERIDDLRERVKYDEVESDKKFTSHWHSIKMFASQYDSFVSTATDIMVHLDDRLTRLEKLRGLVKKSAR